MGCRPPAPGGGGGGSGTGAGGVASVVGVVWGGRMVGSVAGGSVVLTGGPEGTVVVGAEVAAPSDAASPPVSIVRVSPHPTRATATRIAPVHRRTFTKLGRRRPPRSSRRRRPNPTPPNR